MASTLHASFPPAPTGFHRNDSMSSMQYSHGHMHSFDGSQSIASTPAISPPPRAPSQQMSFNMPNGNMMNGMGPQPNYGGYPQLNGYGQQQMPYQHAPKPQIYTAVYSSVSVYEMEVNSVAVMRRRSDSWLNATQILKVAGVEKGKRTKVLEKEILTGEHEKVQGGYGKYQGTWINYRRGVEFCRQYGVEELLRPLLEYDIDQDGIAGQPGTMETPTKEQAMAAQRKRLFNGQDNRPMSQTSNGTFFKNISSTAANAVNALNKARVDSPGPRGMDGRRSVGPRRPSHQFPASQDTGFPSGSQQSMHSIASDSSFGGPVQNAAFPYASNFADFPENGELNEPPRKRVKSSQGDSFVNAVDPGLENSIAMDSPTEPNESFFSQPTDTYHQSIMAGDTGLPPLPFSSTPGEEHKKELLIDLFIDSNRTDFSDHPAFLTLSGEDFEIPIDNSSNTALHWAATLARIPLVRQFIAKGFNARRTNSGGETALIAACQARNNLDHSSFKDLLALLGSTIEVRDGRGRTMLHHIAISSAIRGRTGVGRYYLECLLEFIVQQGDTSSSQSSSGTSISQIRRNSNITLGRFMSEIVNAQDKSGDTALNLAARTSTKSIIHQLIEVGADPYIKNKAGLAPVDFGVGSDIERSADHNAMSNVDTLADGNISSQTSFADTQSEIMSSIRDIFAASELDFAQELRERQTVLDETNAKLKDTGTALAEEVRHLEELRSKVSNKVDLEQRIGNLSRSNKELRQQLSQSNNGKAVMENVPIGEADKGLDIDGTLWRVAHLFPLSSDAMNPEIAFNEEQKAFLSSLERAEVLSGRVKAYQAHNANLENRSENLRGMSKDLENRYRKIVSLCIGVEEAKVDKILLTLVEAIMSEHRDETTDFSRVREFMRMIEGAES